MTNYDASNWSFQQVVEQLGVLTRKLAGLEERLEEAESTLALHDASLEQLTRKRPRPPARAVNSRPELYAKAMALREKGLSYRDAANALNEAGFTTGHGNPWYSQTLYIYMTRTARALTEQKTKEQA